MTERALLPERYPTNEEGLRRLTEAVNDLLLESRLVSRLFGTAVGIYTADVANVTGDGTVYQIACDTVNFGLEPFDGTTYTTPVNAIYAVVLTVFADGLAVQHSHAETTINTPAGSIVRSTTVNTSNQGPALTFHHEEILRLAEGDILTFDFAVFGGPLSVNVRGDATAPETYITVLPLKFLI